MARSEKEVQEVIQATLNTIDRHRQICTRPLDMGVRENYDKLIDMGDFILSILDSFLNNQKIEGQFKNEEWRIVFNKLAIWYFEPYSKESKLLDRRIKDLLKPMPESSDINNWIFGDYPSTHVRTILKEFPTILASIYSPVKRTIGDYNTVEYLTAIKSDFDVVKEHLTCFEKCVLIGYMYSHDNVFKYDHVYVVDYLNKLKEDGNEELKDMEINSETVLKTMNKASKKIHLLLTRPKVCRNWSCSEFNWPVVTLNEVCGKCASALEDI